MAESINLEALDLSLEESRDIIEFLARRRNVSNYERMTNEELLSTLKKNPSKTTQIGKKEKESNFNHSTTTKSGKTRNKPKSNSAKRRKTQNVAPQKLLKLGKRKNTQNLTYEKPSKLTKRENLTPQKQLKTTKQEKSKNNQQQQIKSNQVNNNYIQYESKGDKILTVKEYLGLIESYLADMINDYKSKGERKIQLTAEINFTSLKPDSDETRIMHTKSDNKEIMIGSNTNEVIKELFKSFLLRYQEGLQEKMRGSDFEFDGIHLLYYDFNKISLNRGGSYIESAKWIKDKRSTINPKNNDYKCFQYAVTVALNHNKINEDTQRVSKIKPFINQYNWNDIDFPSTGKDWKKFELNNESIALNVLYNTGRMHLAYKSKHNLTREKQVILLMITDGEKWHYRAVKRLSGLLRGVTCNNNGDFYCLNCFHSYKTENKLDKHKKICENHDYCHVEMPNEDNKIIKYNQGEKSIRPPFILYADLECLLEKISTCYNNLQQKNLQQLK